MASDHVARNDLIAFTLGHANPQTAAHLKTCPSCAAEVDAYRTIMRLTPEVLHGCQATVHVVPCNNSNHLDHHHCDAVDAWGGLHITLKRRNGSLEGLVATPTGACACLDNASIRLFGRQGLVSSSPVGRDGSFNFPYLVPGQRYSLGLVLANGHSVELKIIADLQA
jgi:hypothetical protein